MELPSSTELDASGSADKEIQQQLQQQPQQQPQQQLQQQEPTRSTTASAIALEKTNASRVTNETLTDQVHSLVVVTRAQSSYGSTATGSVSHNNARPQQQQQQQNPSVSRSSAPQSSTSTAVATERDTGRIRTQQQQQQQHGHHTRRSVKPLFRCFSPQQSDDENETELPPLRQSYNATHYQASNGENLNLNIHQNQVNSGSAEATSGSSSFNQQLREMFRDLRARLKMLDSGSGGGAHGSSSVLQQHNHHNNSCVNAGASNNNACANMRGRKQLADGILLSEQPYPVHTTVHYRHHLVPALTDITSAPYYWGVMDRFEAERLLDGKPEGTFLLRDSAQAEYLFSVSFRRYQRTLHARVEQYKHRFSFDSYDPGVFSADTVTALIDNYKDPARCLFFEPQLTHPLNRPFVFPLQHLCRAAIVDTKLSYDQIQRLPVPNSYKDYLGEYHYRQPLGEYHYRQTTATTTPNNNNNSEQQQAGPSTRR